MHANPREWKTVPAPACWPRHGYRWKVRRTSEVRRTFHQHKIEPSPMAATESRPTCLLFPIRVDSCDSWIPVRRPWKAALRAYCNRESTRMNANGKQYLPRPVGRGMGTGGRCDAPRKCVAPSTNISIEPSPMAAMKSRPTCLLFPIRVDSCDSWIPVRRLWKAALRAYCNRESTRMNANGKQYLPRPVGRGMGTGGRCDAPRKCVAPSTNTR